jgi:hypothetical protein
MTDVAALAAAALTSGLSRASRSRANSMDDPPVAFGGRRSRVNSMDDYQHAPPAAIPTPANVLNRQRSGTESLAQFDEPALRSSRMRNDSLAMAFDPLGSLGGGNSSISSTNTSMNSTNSSAGASALGSSLGGRARNDSLAMSLEEGSLALRRLRGESFASGMSSIEEASALLRRQRYESFSRDEASAHSQLIAAVTGGVGIGGSSGGVGPAAVRSPSALGALGSGSASKRMHLDSIDDGAPMSRRPRFMSYDEPISGACACIYIAALLSVTMTTCFMSPCLHVSIKHCH